MLRKAYILSGSGSGFHEFLYSILESLRKIRKIAEFIPNQFRFHEKRLWLISFAACSLISGQVFSVKMQLIRNKLSNFTNFS